MSAADVPEHLTSPELALERAAAVEQRLLAAADTALAEFLGRVRADAADGSIARGAVNGYFRASLERAFSHPTFSSVREDMLGELEQVSELADDAYTAAVEALAVAANSDASADDREQLLGALFAAPTAGLVASLSERLDGWLRRRISKLLVNRIRGLSPADLAREDLVGREYDIPAGPGSSTLVTEDDWISDDRPGEINWRARMQRDIRTAYTRVFGRQMQRQLERYGFVAKRWVSRRDPRVRETHVAADGQTVGLFESFDVGLAQLRFPGDPTGPFRETVNCRCVLVGVGAPSAAAAN